jgi:hypothetical protein
MKDWLMEQRIIKFCAKAQLNATEAYGADSVKECIIFGI